MKSRFFLLSLCLIFLLGLCASVNAKEKAADSQKEAAAAADAIPEAPEVPTRFFRDQNISAFYGPASFPAL